MNNSIRLNSSEDTQKLGALLGACVHDRTFIGLVGQLGAGKTTLTQALARQLGVLEDVNSPTFLMLNEYHSGRVPFYHFDLYRLQEDLDSSSAASRALKAELDEIMESDAVVIVEWINLWNEFGAEYDELRIDISYEPDSDGRIALFTARGQSANQILKRLEGV